MRKYSYRGNIYESFCQLCSSEEWKAGGGKYYFEPRGGGEFIDFDTIEELLKHFSKKEKGGLLKILYGRHTAYATLIHYKENEDGHGEADMERSLVSRWNVIGYVGRKDGTAISKEECMEVVYP